MDRLNSASLAHRAVILAAIAAAILPWTFGRQPRPAVDGSARPAETRPALTAAATPVATPSPASFRATSSVRRLPVEIAARDAGASRRSSRDDRLDAPLVLDAAGRLVASSWPGVHPAGFPAETAPSARNEDGPLLGPAFPDPVSEPPPATPEPQPGAFEERPLGEDAPDPPPLPTEDLPLDGEAPIGRAPIDPTPPPLPLSRWSAAPLRPGLPAQRSEQLEQLARQADQLTRHGFELASLRAYFAARSEFIAALRLLAQGLDTEHQTGAHGRSLAAGLTALREADDFLPGRSRYETDIDVRPILRGHVTPALQDATPEGLTLLAALQCYLTYAQEQLAASVGQEVAGSMALHALGKLHAAMAAEKYEEIRAGEAKAVVFHQAALLVLPGNAMAANDLGVLLARSGNHQEARRLLEHSVLVAPQSTTWHNLAVVYRALEREELARSAVAQADAARRAEAARGADVAMRGPSVRWVDPSVFAGGGGRSGSPPAAPAGPVPAPAAPPFASSAATRTEQAPPRAAGEAPKGFPWPNPFKRN